MDDKSLKHYGTPRRSGRYPWGSGDDPYQRTQSFLGTVKSFEDEGMSEKEIAEALGLTTTTLRARISIASDEDRKYNIAQVRKLKEKGWSTTAIADKLGRNESTVRSWLKPGVEARANKTVETADFLADAVTKTGYLDIGVGTEYSAGVSRTKLKTAVSLLEDEGYKVYEIKTPQLGTDKMTTVQVLAPPGTTFMDVVNNRDKIGVIGGVVKDTEGKSILGLEPVNSVSSSRVKIKYAEDGGTDKDGLIEVRRGVPELSLGNNKYAQVRVGVDGTHFLKGMAMYSDDIPDGYDVVYNVNKPKGTPPDKVFKAMKTKKDGSIDQDNPFGAQVMQKKYKDKDGNDKLSALNFVNEEGKWGDWSKNLSSQFLSKQRPTLIKKQLDLAAKLKQEEYDEIMTITNPTVRKKLLESFADGADSDAVHLKAAALPRQNTKVILPFPGMKEGEVYAPTYRDGEKVVLVRHPHGGTFEIPELTVNNRYAVAKKLIGPAEDAIGIHPKTAQQLSGADFDGDTVIVIPNPKSVNIKTSKPLKELDNFDPLMYKNDKLPKMKDKTKQNEMGKVSNLITDMTIKGASHSDIAKAVKHSMVVIDAEKHNLDYKQSYIDNDIAALKKTYQGGERKGASTLISKSKSQARVPHRVEGKLMKDPKTGKVKRVYVDPETGKKLYETTGDSYVNKKGKTVRRTTMSTKMYEADDAYELMSKPGTPKEALYADYANKMKALGNKARKEALNTPPLKYSPSAKSTYAKEVDSLNAKLNIALKNKPFERRAQLVANKVVALKKKEYPDMTKDDLKKVKGQALAESRVRVGAKKHQVDITAREWEAIQAGAVSNTKLKQILDNTDDDHIKKLATPRTKLGMTTGKASVARTMLNNGYTQAEIADHLGVSVSLINDIVKP